LPITADSCKQISCSYHITTIQKPEVPEEQAPCQQ
jgi:hypothetical protein